MALFLSIPHDISYSLFCEWLVGEDLIGLDTAFCRKTWRPRLLELFAVLPPLRFQRFPVNLLKWVHYRNLKLRNLLLSNEHFNNDNQLVWPIIRNSVEELTVEYFPKADNIVLVVNSFENVKSLEAEALLIRKVCVEVMRQLTKLKVILSYDLTTNVAPGNINVCCNLKFLSIRGPVSSSIFLLRSNTEAFISLIKRNPRLEIIELNAVIDVLEPIIASCYNIKRIRLSTDRIVFFTLAKAVLHCAQLECLHVETNGSKVVYQRNLELILHDYNGQVGKTELFSAVAGLCTLDLEGPVFDTEIEAAVAGSVSTLDSITIRRGTLLSHSSLITILSCKSLKSLVLVSNIDDELILNAFLESSPKGLTLLSLRNLGLSALTVFTIVQMCSNLSTIFFSGVVENSPDVHKLVQYLRSEDHRNDCMTCDIEFTGGGGLYFAEGRFGGTNVNQYLTEEEIRTNKYFNADDDL